MADITIEKIITLMFIPGVGSQTISKILDHFPIFETAQISTIIRELKEQKIIRRNILTPSLKIINQAKQFCEKAQNFCLKNKITIFELNNSTYPQPLLTMKSSPLLLFSQGNRQYNYEKTIAIIGTRMPTAFGQASAQKITLQACHKGYDILSGLATGIDTTAHTTALDNKAKTIAIIAHGHDTVYPLQNRNLFERIKNEGLIYSEYPPGFKPLKYHFLMRDKIQAALSKRLILIETEKKGGAIHTINNALKLEKKIGLVSGHKVKKGEPLKNSGNIMLLNNERIKEKIQILSNKKDLLKFL